MKKNIIPIVVLVFVLALPLGIAAAAQSSSTLEFNTTEDFYRLNTTNSWNSSLVTITSNSTDIDISVENSTINYTGSGTIDFYIQLANGTLTNQTNITGTAGNSTGFYVTLNQSSIDFEPSLVNVTMNVTNGTEWLPLTFELDLLHDLNTTIYDVYENSTGGVDFGTENITTHLNVTYPFNITAGLTRDNFQSVVLESNDVSSFADQTLNVTTVEYLGDGIGYNVTLENTTTVPGGNYNLTITNNVTDDQANQTSTDTQENIFIKGVGLAISGIGTQTIEEDSSKTVTITITNHGDTLANGASLSLSEPSDVTVEFEEDTTGNACSQQSSLGDQSALFDVSAHDSCTMAVKIITDTVSDDVTRTIIVTGGGSAVNWYGTESFDVKITDESSSTSTTSSTSSSSAASTAAAADEDEHELTINSYPSLIEVVQGNSSTIELEIENTGDLDEENVLVYVDDIESSWVTLPPSFRLNDGNDKTVEITFTVPNTTRVKEYNITIGAANDDVGVSTDTRFRVMPSAETIAALNTTLEELEENVTQFEKDVLKALKEINESDRTQHESDLESIKSKLSTAKESSDNFTTASLIAEIQDDMASTRNALGIEEGSSSLPWGRIILITLGSIAGLGVVALVVYMILPPNEGVAAAKSAKKPLSERLKEFWKKLFKKKGYDPKKGFRH